MTAEAEAEGTYIEQLRKAKGLTRGQIAAYTSLSVGYIGLVVNGRRSLSDHARAKIANVLGVTSTDLLQARGTVKSGDIDVAAFQKAVRSSSLVELLTIKYGERGRLIAEAIEVIIRYVSVDD